MIDYEIINAVEDLDDDLVVKLVINRLNNGVTTSFIKDQINIGMEKVGNLYEEGDYYIADLIVAGRLFQRVLDLDEMKPKQSQVADSAGVLLLGTAKGDLHDIGKGIFCSLMKASGFEVHDLGIDVSAETFYKAIIEIEPDILGISGVLSPVIWSMKEIIQYLEDKNVRHKVKIILGGSIFSPETCAQLSADACTKDASKGVDICLSWMKEIRDMQKNTK